MSVTKRVTRCDHVTSLKTIDVEYLLEWRYRRQKADLIVDRGMGLNEIEAAAPGGPLCANLAAGHPNPPHHQ